MFLGIVLAAATLVACGSEIPESKEGGRIATVEEAAEHWTCSMHPNIHMDGPGRCPICGMDLIPVEAPSAGEGEEGRPVLEMSEHAMKLAEIQTMAVVRGTAGAEIRLVGKLEPDETRVRDISAWVPGSRRASGRFRASRSARPVGQRGRAAAASGGSPPPFSPHSRAPLRGCSR
jgi:hypothetical protein